MTLKLVSRQLNGYCHNNVFLQIIQFQKSLTCAKHGKIDFGASVEKIEKYKFGKKGPNIFRFEQMDDLIKLQNELQIYQKERIQNEIIFSSIFNMFKNIYEKQENELETLRGVIRQSK